MFSIKVQFEIITQDSRSGKRCRVQAGMLKFQSIKYSLRVQENPQVTVLLEGYDRSISNWFGGDIPPKKFTIHNSESHSRILCVKPQFTLATGDNSPPVIHSTHGRLGVWPPISPKPLGAISLLSSLTHSNSDCPLRSLVSSLWSLLLSQPFPFKPSLKRCGYHSPVADSFSPFEFTNHRR